MGQRSIRFPDELEARGEAVAARQDRSFSWLVVRALEAMLGDDTQATQAQAAMPADGVATRTRDKASATGPVTARGASRPPASPRTPVAATNGTPAYRCPTRGCEFTAMSPAAKCSRHGRTVKAA